MASFVRSRGAFSPFHLVVAGVTGLLLAGLLVPYSREATLTTSTVEGGVAAGAGGGSAVGGSGSGSGTGTVSGGTTSGAGTAPGGADSGTTGSGGRGGSSAGSGVGSGATGDIGVTATEIHVGIGILDIGAAANFGFNFDLGDQRARYQALVDDVNGRGGISGRTIVPHYRTIEALSPETSQAACVGWVHDDHVFAALVSSQFSQAATVCVIGEGNTPLFTSDGIDDSYYANGRFYTTQPSDNRILRDQAAYLLQTGVLEGRTIGVLSGDGAERLAIDNTLVPAIEAGGYTVSDVEVIPADISGTQRMSIAISNFKAAGVDFVIIAANVILAGPFVQSADRAGFNPQYAISDFNQQINDQVASYYPDSFEGTIGLSTRRFTEYRAGNPSPPADQACLDRVHPVDPKILPSTNASFEVAMHECGIFDAFVQGASNAGPNLNRSTLQAGIEQITSTGVPGAYDGGFGPGKHDEVANVREVAWHRDCTCWQIAGPVRRMVG
jgi:ABC-type branched-subunit amino acid transport system substrate-binding protein